LAAGSLPGLRMGTNPAAKKAATYDLEYGSDTLEIHADAIRPGQRVLMVDDLLATGGTMRACCDLVEQLGGNIISLAFLIELAGLKGRDKLSKWEVHSVLRYD
jgi:adenine phosphoribosyltransferase